MAASRHSIALPPPARRLFCNRTLNIRGIRAIGFDMDYTLVHYHSEEWERRAYEHSRDRIAAERGWAVKHLEYDPELVTLGLVMDLELGNVVKSNRFGFVKRAYHGTKPLPFEEQRRAYARVLVDVTEPRWVFMNTLFSLSEATLFSQLVELLDADRLDPALGYADLYRVVKSSIDAAHMEGALKEEILADPARFVDLDEELPLALLDMKHAGKKLLVVTNSEWHYTRGMMSWVFDRFLPGETTWRDVFDLVIVEARKPSFFESQSPIFEVVDDDGLLRPVVGGLQSGRAYLGGNAALVEKHIGVPGEEIPYFGDHIYGDVRASKALLRWRTGLVLRELERELDALEAFQPKQAELTHLMEEKERLEHGYSQMRLDVQRSEKGYGPKPSTAVPRLRERMRALREELVALDVRIAPLAKASGELVNERWGPLMRAGNDKSHLARIIEGYADVYTSRVSNLLLHTPFVYLRSPRGSLPHDSGPGGGV